MIRDTPSLASAAKDYSANAAAFSDDFNAAWVKVMNNDRFDGPTGSACSAQVEILA
jgi:catalase (peroxidase I)